MNRRSFLKVLGFGIPGLALLRFGPTAIEPIVPETGFGLAPIKAQGSAILYDAQFPKALWPGINAFFGEQYAEFDADFRELF